MERTLRLVLAYDGTDFHGWQRQPGLRTVQEELENALRRVLRHPLSAAGASRTDAGVHARGQVAAVRTTCPIPTSRVTLAIGHRLPPDLAIVAADDAPEGFHPARSARAKLYKYTIYNDDRRPVEELCQRYAWHVWFRLDLDRMRAAAAELVGRHDFAGFATPGSPRSTTVRTIFGFDIRRRQREVVLAVSGDGFLYHQVRNMVGTLVEIGRGHWPPERIGEILASGQRSLAGPLAPACGLCLEWVRYDVGVGDGVERAGGAGDGSGPPRRTGDCPTAGAGGLSNRRASPELSG